MAHRHSLYFKVSTATPAVQMYPVLGIWPQHTTHAHLLLQAQHPLVDSADAPCSKRLIATCYTSVQRMYLCIVHMLSSIPNICFDSGISSPH